MECPHCGYEVEDSEPYLEIGGPGRFFKLSICPMTQLRMWFDDEVHEVRATLLACPSCCKTFIEKEQQVHGTK